MVSKVQPATGQSADEVRQNAEKPKRLPPNAGKGRKKGVPNKVTKDAREAMAALAEGMAPKLSEWLARGADGYGVAKWKDENGEEHVMRVTLSMLQEGKVPVEAKVTWTVKPAPLATSDTLIRALEYHIPKLSRAEVTGRDGKDLIPATINIKGVKAPRRE